MLKIKLRSSCLCSKQFTDWVILWVTDDHMYFIDMHTHCHMHICTRHVCKRSLQQKVMSREWRNITPICTLYMCERYLQQTVISQESEMSQYRMSSGPKNGIMWGSSFFGPRTFSGSLCCKWSYPWFWIQLSVKITLGAQRRCSTCNLWLHPPACLIAILSPSKSQTLHNWLDSICAAGRRPGGKGWGEGKTLVVYTEPVVCRYTEGQLSILL